MKVLITHEKSQKVCIAFRKLGIEAYSNDIEDCYGGHPEWHLKMDCKEAMKLKDWDFIGMHPVCTKIVISGNRHYAKGKPQHNERLEAVEYTIGLWELACSIAEYVYMENPLGAMNSDARLPKPQIVHPYYFGDAVSKATCLWRKNLPALKYAMSDNLFDKKTSVAPEWVIYNSKKSASGKSKYSILGTLPTTGNNEKNRQIRSETFTGIANAISEQWSFSVFSFGEGKKIENTNCR